MSHCGGYAKSIVRIPQTLDIYLSQDQVPSFGILKSLEPEVIIKVSRMTSKCAGTASRMCESSTQRDTGARIPFTFVAMSMSVLTLELFLRDLGQNASAVLSCLAYVFALQSIVYHCNELFVIYSRLSERRRERQRVISSWTQARTPILLYIHADMFMQTNFCMQKDVCRWTQLGNHRSYVTDTLPS